MLTNPLSEEDSTQFCLGVSQFNEHAFFECHETLEKIWLKQEGDTKELVQGLIQIAVGYHHMLNGNSKGAIKLLNRGLERVAKYKPAALGLALSDLCRGVQTSLVQLQNNPEVQADPSSIPRVRFL